MLAQLNTRGSIWGVSLGSKMLTSTLKIKETPPAFANGVFCEMNYPVATAPGTDST